MLISDGSRNSVPLDKSPAIITNTPGPAMVHLLVEVGAQLRAEQAVVTAVMYGVPC